MTDGEVAVRENGQVTAIQTDGFDGQISVSLDHADGVAVGVPTDASVTYEDPDARTDGGPAVAEHVEITHRGAGLGEEYAGYALAAAVVAYVAAGHAFANGRVIVAGGIFAVGLVLTGILRRAKEDGLE